MTNFNTCERVHGDIEGFFGALAAAAAEGHAAGTIDTHETGQQDRPFSFGKVVGLGISQAFSDMAAVSKPITYRPEFQQPLN